MAKKLLFAAALAALTAFSSNTYAESNQSLTQQIEQVKSKYQTHLDKVKSEAEGLTDDTPSDTEIGVGVRIKTGMELQEFKMDIPEFVMKLQRWVFHVPQVTMKLHTWKINIPGTGMRLRDIGFGIKMHVPTFWTDVRVIKLHIPEFKMAPVEVKLHIPEVTMKTQTMKMHLPTFTVEDAKAVIKDKERKGNQLAAQAKSISQDMRDEINGLVRTNLTQKRAELLKKFNSSIKSLQDTVVAWSNNKDAQGAVAKMKSDLDKLIKDRNKFIAEMDKKISKLNS